jgi:hypothetical protein
MRFPGLETAFPGPELPVPRAELPVPRAELVFPGSEIDFPGRNLLLPRRVTGIKTRKSNKGAGVPYFDSIATYDSGLLFDDPSSPQPARKKNVEGCFIHRWRVFVGLFKTP